MANAGTLKDSADAANAEKAIIKEKAPEKMSGAEKIETKMLNTRIPKDLIKRLKVYCIENEITIQDCITQVIREKLEQEDKAGE